MFISKKVLQLMEENAQIKAENAALAAESKVFGRRVEQLEEIERARQEEERKIGKQFDNLFGYSGLQQGGNMHAD